MLLREIIAVYCEDLLKHINILCGQSAALNLKFYGSYSDHLAKCTVTALHAKPVFSCALKLPTPSGKTFVSCFIMIKWSLLCYNPSMCTKLTHITPSHTVQIHAIKPEI
jgi:hypothetical protein